MKICDLLSLKTIKLDLKANTKADVIDELVDLGLVGRALIVARGAVTVDPTSVKARLAWADMLIMANQEQRAVEEYKNVLLLDPDNQEARGRLGELQIVESGGVEMEEGLKSEEY